jgi:hypothetical protein
MVWNSEQQQHESSESRGRVRHALCDGTSTGETKESMAMRRWGDDIESECYAKGARVGSNGERREKHDVT